MSTERDNIFYPDKNYNTIAKNNNDNESEDLDSLDDLVVVHDGETHISNGATNLGDVSLSLLTACLCTGAFLAALDSSIVATIFNIIGTEFQSSNLAIWVLTSYLLSASALQPLYSKFSEIFGRKTTLVFIGTFFLVGSIGCGAAQNMIQLGVARAIAGCGGAGLMVMSSVIIHDLVEMKNRGQYQSYVNMAQTSGAVVGAPLGGLINDVFGWRHCFYLNVPPCLFILYVYVYKLENYNLSVTNSHSSCNLSVKLRQIDYSGAFLLLVANAAFVIAASFGGNTYDWSDPLIVALLIICPVFFILFGINEMYWAKHPLISKTLIKDTNVVAVCLNNFFLCNSTMTMGFLVPQFFMGVLGYPTSSAGLWVLPRAISVFIGCWVAGRYLAVKGKYYRYIVAVVVCQFISTVWIYQWVPSTSMWSKIASMQIEGYAFGSIFVVTMVALVADIPQEETASATSMLFLCRSTGWLTGGSLTSAILQFHLKKNLVKNITGPESEAIIEFIRTSIAKVRTLSPEIQVIVIKALQDAIHSSMLYAVGTSLLCFSVTLLLKNVDLFQTRKSPSK